ARRHDKAGTATLNGTLGHETDFFLTMSTMPVACFADYAPAFSDWVGPVALSGELKEREGRRVWHSSGTIQNPRPEDKPEWPPFSFAWQLNSASSSTFELRG